MEFSLIQSGVIHFRVAEFPQKCLAVINMFAYDFNLPVIVLFRHFCFVSVETISFRLQIMLLSPNTSNVASGKNQSEHICECSLTKKASFNFSASMCDSIERTNNRR